MKKHSKRLKRLEETQTRMDAKLNLLKPPLYKVEQSVSALEKSVSKAEPTLLLHESRLMGIVIDVGMPH